MLLSQLIQTLGPWRKASAECRYSPRESPGEHADKSSWGAEALDFSSRRRAMPTKRVRRRLSHLASMLRETKRAARSKLHSCSPKRPRTPEKLPSRPPSTVSDKHLETIDDQNPTDEQPSPTEDLDGQDRNAQRHPSPTSKLIEAKSATTAVDAGSQDHGRRAAATARAPRLVSAVQREEGRADRSILSRAARRRDAWRKRKTPTSMSFRATAKDRWRR